MANTSKSHHPRTEWKLGESGNPKGRPREALADLIRRKKNLPRDLVDGVIKIFRTTRDENTKLKAADWLADRGWGRPTQHVESDSLAAVFENLRAQYDAENLKIE